MFTLWNVYCVLYPFFLHPSFVHVYTSSSYHQANRQLNKLYVDELERITKEQLAAERQKELAKRQENIECKRIQEQQALENAKRRAAEQAQRLREENEALHKVKQEDDIFAQFALAEIQRFKEMGDKARRTDLLKKAIAM